MKRVVALVIVLCMAVTFVVSCKKAPVTTTSGTDVTTTTGSGTVDPVTKAKEYTYHGYSSALGNNWNPHTWETNAEQAIQDYISMPFCTMSIKDSENGVYQWVYEMATSIADVTKDHKDDLTKYKVTLPAGKTADQVENGYVFEIKLNDKAKWENGEAINADTYIDSMKKLLDSKMKNYRANLYYSGESAVAGGLAFYNSESPIYDPMVPPYGDDEEGDHSYDLDAGIARGEVYINLSSKETTLMGANYTLNSLHSDYGAGTDEDFKLLSDATNAYGYTKVTAENKEAVMRVLTAVLALFGVSGDEAVALYAKEAMFVNTGKLGEKVGYDAVGCYKVDDYTIRYVTQTAIDYNYFLTSCTSTWLVYAPLYEAGYDTTGELKTTNYCTSQKTSMSYGPYKISSYEDDKQIVFVQNENWYGWEKQSDGSLVSYTNFLVDGEKKQQYQTTKIVIDVMDDAAAKQAFLKGALSEWTPTADDLGAYGASDRLYKVDETYTQSLFFDCRLEDLKTMDASKGNKNSVVISNADFRKAFSLSIDRAEWVKSTNGYKPAYALMNNLYFYDVYNDPTSSYRSSDEAMQAVCDLYGVKYGEGTPYKDLRAAYKSINGYNLTEAKALMKVACDKLVADGVYKAGEEIKIRLAWMKGALDSPAYKQVELLQKYINAAIEGSGFGKITFEPVGNLNDRYGDVGKRGDFAIGYGAWGGAAFYPFRNLQVYCDSDQYSLNEARCWDPASETYTMTVNGEEVTMTWKDWSGALIGTGRFAEADNKVKLAITAELEKAFLEKYYRIPLAGSTACFLMGFQCDYYTENYNIMYDFGGFRLMKYNYTDAEWADYVASHSGALKYE